MGLRSRVEVAPPGRSMPVVVGTHHKKERAVSLWT